MSAEQALQIWGWKGALRLRGPGERDQSYTHGRKRAIQRLPPAPLPALRHAPRESPGTPRGRRRHPPCFSLRTQPFQVARGAGTQGTGRTPDVAEHASSECMAGTRRVQGTRRSRSGRLCFSHARHPLPPSPLPRPPATTRLHAGRTPQGREEEEGG